MSLSLGVFPPFGVPLAAFAPAAVTLPVDFAAGDLAGRAFATSLMVDFLGGLFWVDTTVPLFAYLQTNDDASRSVKYGL